MQGVIFPIVVLDEGSQCSEPEALIPLVKGSQQIVLVGDHHQLPPVCQSTEAARQGLATSLFERLINAGVPSTMLQVNTSSIHNAGYVGARLGLVVRWLLTC